MKSMKDMKKAIAEFRALFTTMLAQVTVRAIRLATSPFSRRPKLFMFFMLFMVNYLLSIDVTGKNFKFLRPCNTE